MSKIRQCEEYPATAVAVEPKEVIEVAEKPAKKKKK